jgi:3-methyladenine DNA glycosylase/8-oxoguanine DNA glycosylase
MADVGVAGANFSVKPRGPFDLANQNRFFGGWPTLPGEQTALVLSFPVEGWDGSAAVVLRQARSNAGQAAGQITGQIFGSSKNVPKAKEQALAALSLDVDGSGWPAVGERDPVIGELQKKYGLVRPVLFHSPYEAAAHFMIGHRISMLQARAIRVRVAEEFGEAIQVGSTKFYAFPMPQRLLEIKSIKGLPERKIERLHGVARAALSGLLDREQLRARAKKSLAETLKELQDIHGVGPFFASGILFRGAGLVDELMDDARTLRTVQQAYKKTESLTVEQLKTIAEAWRPYRTWATILQHIWARREAA